MRVQQGSTFQMKKNPYTYDRISFSGGRARGSARCAFFASINRTRAHLMFRLQECQVVIILKMLLLRVLPGGRKPTAEIHIHKHCNYMSVRTEGKVAREIKMLK